MNLNQFSIETFPDWIGFLLIVACALWLGWECLVSYCDRQPIYDPMVSGMPDQAEIASEHCAKMAKKPVTAQQFRTIMKLTQDEGSRRLKVSEILSDMGLRRPLPEVTKSEHNEWMEHFDSLSEPVPVTSEARLNRILKMDGISDADRADILRGTKLP